MVVLEATVCAADAFLLLYSALYITEPQFADLQCL